MSNKEIQEFNEKLRRGLELAEKRMLQEKALRGQDVVVCGADQIKKASLLTLTHRGACSLRLFYDMVARTSMVCDNDDARRS